MRVQDLTNVETEHMLGLTFGPIAHLSEAAARAEYESDLYHELVRKGMPEDGISLIFKAVRSGEIRRATHTDGAN